MEKNVSALVVIIVLLGCLSVWQYYWHITEITSLDSQITNLVREMLNLIASYLSKLTICFSKTSEPDSLTNLSLKALIVGLNHFSIS
jgi:hypothetical protein